MRKLIVLSFVTLDGVMHTLGGLQEDPFAGFKHGGWAVGYFTKGESVGYDSTVDGERSRTERTLTSH